MIDLLPTLFFFIVAAFFLHYNNGRPVVQVYFIIVLGYLNVFPLLDFLFQLELGFKMEAFARFQVYIIALFELPLMYFLSRTDRGVHRSPADSSLHPRRLRLSLILLFFLSALLLAFWFISLRYDLFFVRMGYQGVQDAPPSTPLIFLYLYRAAVETSFFVILFLFYTLRATAKTASYRSDYKALLIGYLLTFLVFYVVNSRAHLLLLILLLMCTQARADIVSTKGFKLVVVGVAAFGLLIVHTLLRELLEKNDRLDFSTILTVTGSIVGLIAGRLNSLVMLNALANTEFDPFGFQLSGLMHLVDFNIAFITDSQAYANIKASEVTSPSVEIVNRLLSVSEVDFPKSHVLDVFLIFGVYGLFILAIFLGRTISLIQRHTQRGPNFSKSFLVAIYTLTLLFQFDKEFLGFVINFLKWSPILLLIVYLRPRNTGGAKTQLLPHLSSSVGTVRVEKANIVDV